MKVQIIRYEKDMKKYNNNIVVSTLSSPRSLDEFDVNVIDISDSNLWRYKGENFVNIDAINDFESIEMMLERCEKSDVIVVLPQNVKVMWQASAVHTGRYYQDMPLKDKLPVAIKIVSRILPCTVSPIQIYFENTRTSIQGKTYLADFNFETYGYGEAVTRSNQSEKITTVKLVDGLFVTALDVTSDADKLQNFLDFLFVKGSLDEMPDWIKDMEFFDDSEQKDLVEKQRKEIERAEEQIGKAELKLKENLKYKSILCYNGDALVSVVFEMLEEILDCDLSEFEDIKKEDFLIKKEKCTFIGEIKGVTSNVKNEHISQVDVHYQKYMDKLDEEKKQEHVKEILIMNAFRNKKLSEREPINDQQIQLAERNGCLIIETITLLKLFELFKQDKITSEECEDMFISNVGLLRIEECIK